MAGFTNVLSGISMIGNLVGGLSGYQDDRAAQKASLRALQAKQDAEYQHAAAQAALEREKIAQDAASSEADRKAALKRAVARQRALFGASGVTQEDGGSAQAVLLGLVDESDEERRQREALDQLRYQALDSDLDYKKRVNVLELNELRERQKIGDVTGLAKTIGKTTSILS